MRKPVLIVEDDADIRENLSLIFREEGLSVHVASDGREAINILTQSERLPCVVFLDLMMPVMSGIEMLEELNRSNSDLLKDIPIILITAAPLSGERENSIRPFVTEVIRKPFRLDQVINAVHRHCG